MLAISNTCRDALRCGTPLTHMYASPIVSTCDTMTSHRTRYRSRQFNGQYLVDVMFFNDGVEAGVEVVEKVNHLHGRGFGRDVGERNYVGKVDGCFVEKLRKNRLANFKTFSHRTSNKQHVVILFTNNQHRYGLVYGVTLPWQHLTEQIFCLLLLNHQFFGSFRNLLLQVIGVLLQVLQHAVHKVDLPATDRTSSFTMRQHPVNLWIPLTSLRLQTQSL